MNDKKRKGRSEYENKGYVSNHDAKVRKRSFSDSTVQSTTVDDEIGHFHPRPNESIRGRYDIKKDLGKGTFGKVFQCYDRKHQDKVAIKIIRSIKRYVESAQIEADILDYIYDEQKRSNKNYCVKMFSYFHFHGHFCLVFETLGLSLLDLIKENDYKRLPLEYVINLARQLISALQFLKSIKLIHTDLKVENVLFIQSAMESRTVQQNGKFYNIRVPINSQIKLIDFGGATYDDDRNKSTVINTRQYRGPEVILELGWSFPSDMWSIGCMIVELYCGDLPFQTHDELEHLALIERGCGPIPLKMSQTSKYFEEFFHSDGRVRFEVLDKKSKEFVLQMLRIQDIFRLSPEDESSGIVELVSQSLLIDPNKRLTPSEALDMKIFQTTNTSSQIVASEASSHHQQWII